MRLIAEDGLEGLISKVESACKQTNLEREAMGLTYPELTFLVRINWSDDLNTSGKFKMNYDLKSEEMALNFLNIVHWYSTEKIREISKVYKFIKESDKILKKFNYSPEDLYIIAEEIIKNPERIQSKIIQSNSKTKKKINENKLKKKINILIEKGKHLKEYLELIKKNAVSLFEKSNYISIIRHEMDHADIYNSKYIRQFVEKRIIYNKLYEKYETSKDSKDLDKLKEISYELLHEFPLVGSVIEERALFFTTTPKDEWGNIDIEKKSKEIYTRFNNAYIKSEYNEAINNLFTNTKYNFQTKDDNKRMSRIDIIKQIREIARYKTDFKELAKTVAKRIVKAYKNDIKMLNEIKNIETHEDLYKIFVK
ncbi:MAG: hypothetical protein GWP09_00280 [Nitrospiraceae bacterium]|nr:hypothetical protein [Nitrospiraceae bacterium]